MQELNKVSLVLTGQLFMEIADECKLMHKEKQMCNNLVKMMERSISKPYSKMYESDHEFVLNALNIKQRMISKIAKMNEAEAMLLSEYLDGNTSGNINFNKI